MDGKGFQTPCHATTVACICKAALPLTSLSTPPPRGSFGAFSIGAIFVAETDPPLLSVFEAPIARLRGAHFVNWVQDLFSREALSVGRPATRIAYLVLWDRAFQNGDRIVVVGEHMAGTLFVGPSRVRVIPNWHNGV